MKLFTELKRRNVFRVAAAYAVASWLVIEVSSVVMPIFGAPEWVLKLLMVFITVGFVCALMLSWLFEVTPDGIKLEEDVDRSQSITSETAKKLDRLTIALVVVGLVVVGIDRMIPEQAASTRVPEVTVPVDETENSATPETESEQAAANDKTIAVLPFANMSADADNEFFADGLSEELLNVLAKVQGLKVAGRTSSFHFKGKNEDLRQIGLALGVANILEGSVRRQGDQVRITAQLVKVDDGFHLWSETYDRTLDDIFAIQDDIAQSVVSALKVTLLGAATVSEISSKRDVNANIHARYLAARARQNQRILEDLRVARDMFESITLEAPDFAPGWAGLATSTLLLRSNHSDLPLDLALMISGDAMQRALALDPDSAEALSAKGYWHFMDYSERGNSDGLELAISANAKAIEIDPQFVQSIYWLAIAMEMSQRLNEAIKYYNRALDIDPLARVPAMRRVVVLGELGREAEARQAAEYIVSAFPGYSLVGVNLAQWAEARGSMDEAFAYLERSLQQDPGDGLSATGAAIAVHNLGDLTRTKKILKNIQAPEAAAEDARIYLAGLDGDREQVVALYQARAERESGGVSLNLATAQVVAGQAESALAMYRQLQPAWFQEAPAVASSLGAHVGFAVLALQSTGMPSQATRLLDAAIGALEPTRASGSAGQLGQDRISLRVLLDDLDPAVTELQEAIEKRYRRIATIDGLTFDTDPRFARAIQDPRFVALLDEIKASNAQALERLNTGQTRIIGQANEVL